MFLQQKDLVVFLPSMQTLFKTMVKKILAQQVILAGNKLNKHNSAADSD